MALVLGVVMIGLLVLGGFFGGGIVAWFALRDGSARDTSERDAVSHMVALGDGRAIFVQGYGIGAPMRVRGVHVDGSQLREDWTWDAPPNLGSERLAWRTGGSIAATELRTATGESSEDHLAVFHVERGFVGRADRIESGGFLISDDGASILVRHADAIVLYGTGEGLPVTWRLAASPPNMVPRLALTPSFAIAYDSNTRILRRADGSLVREIPSGPKIAGIDRAREEIMWLRDGHIVVASLETGAERMAIDLGGGTPVVDGMEEPSLLGSHGGRWIFIYATELDHSFQMNGRGWLRSAPRFVAAVDPANGAVVWRTPIGPWPRPMSVFTNGIYDDAELGEDFLFYSDADTENGGSVNGHLAYISLTDGTIRSVIDYPHATRGNALFTRAGNAAYLRVRGENEASRSALVRFEDGRFTGAIFLADFGGDPIASMFREDEAWIPTGEGRWAFVGSDLRARAQSEGSPALRDASAWARERLQLSR